MFGRSASAPAEPRNPNALDADELSMLDGSEVNVDVADSFVRVTVRRKLELKGTKVVLGRALIKSIAAHIMLAECGQSQNNGGGIVPASALPPAPSSGQRS